LTKNFEKSSVMPEGEVLEVHGDSVLIRIIAKVEPKTFNSHMAVKFAPTLKYGSQEINLPVQYLKGEKVKTTFLGSKTISYKNGGRFVYQQKVPYTEDMKESILKLEFSIELISKYEELNQCIGTRSDTSYGTVTTSQTVKRTDSLIFGNHNKGSSSASTVP